MPDLHVVSGVCRCKVVGQPECSVRKRRGMLEIGELIGAVSCMLRVQDSNSCAGWRFSRRERGRGPGRNEAQRCICFFMLLLSQHGHEA